MLFLRNLGLDSGAYGRLLLRLTWCMSLCTEDGPELGGLRCQEETLKREGGRR